MENKAIGIFDSGSGGLTVFKAIKKLLPDERLIYFGDFARIPYGTKSKKLVQQYALEDARFLMQYDIKMIVVACNTASSMALDFLKDNVDIPVVGVVKPGAMAAAGKTRNNSIGVIGTSATINSNAYSQAILENLPQADIYSNACPLLVPLVEEGWLDNKITQLTLKIYLKDILDNNIDTLILGCTHYPLLGATIQKIVGSHIQLIDSGQETAKTVYEVLTKNNLHNKGSKKDDDQFFVSDIPQKFEEIASRFLGEPLKNVKQVSFDDMNLGVDIISK